MRIIPITLEGDNLGKRHKYLNNLVNETFKTNVPFDSIQHIPEKSAIDKLFKIDLAAKYRNVDYIVQTLKDEEMLYVSRAMKCTWLVSDTKYIHIMNPAYLEKNVYPEMRTNATNKMKFWIKSNLKDSHRSMDFYEYYKKEDNEYALKFLPQCPIEFFLQEMEVIPHHNINPQYLKLLCERSPRAAEIYFKKIEKVGNVNFVFITKMQGLLKTYPDIYFYVVENFFLYNFKRLNKNVTHYIMKYHRDKFEAKPELYAARILDLSELAKFLSSQETQKLVLKLAKASYLYRESYQFKYEFVKPLFKAIDVKDRSNFGTKIFKEKQFGEFVKEPPYLIPSVPSAANRIEKTLDEDNENYDKLLIDEDVEYRCTSNQSGSGSVCKFVTDLDKLYDEYRFKGFQKTYAELTKRILQESKLNTRQNMMLVLVSKTGGRMENVETLMKYLLKKHSNETIQVRAAIVRSLVKRAFAWRWPEVHWKLLLEFGYDLGLDGTTSRVECREGQHAVLLRYILLNEECSPILWDTFLNNFTPLTEYKLNSSERQFLHERLPTLLLSLAKNNSNKPDIFIKRLTNVYEALNAYEISIKNYPEVLEALAEFAPKHVALSEPLLLWLFKASIGRKLLFKANFEILNTDASYVNVMRHDISLLSDKSFEDLLVNIDNLHHDQFLRKLAIYFNEDQGLAVRYLEILQHKAIEQPHIKFARPIALLAGSRSVTWPALDATHSEIKKQNYRKMMISLQKNLRLTSESIPLHTEPKDGSLSALANWVHTCSPKMLADTFEYLMANPRQARLVLVLRATKLQGIIAKTIPYAAQKRPMRTLRIVLRILRRYPKVFSPEDYETLKKLITTINLKGYNFDSYCNLARINNIPKEFRAEYSVLLYQNLAKLGFGPERDCKPDYQIALPLLKCIKNNVNEIDSLHLKEILKTFINKEFSTIVLQQFKNDNNDKYRTEFFYASHYTNIFMKLIARYMITSKSDEDMKDRVLEIYEPFETKLKQLWHIDRVGTFYYGLGYFENFLRGLLWSKVFVSNNDLSLPILNKVCSFGDEIAPLIQNFSLNCGIRLIRFFRQAVKLNVQKRPHLFKNGKVEEDEAISCVIVTFAEVLAEDVEKLTAIYFPTIRLFYTKAIMTFLKRYKMRFYINDLIRGLIKDKLKLNAVIIGLSFHNAAHREFIKYTCNNDLHQDIENIIKNTTEEFFYHEFFENLSNARYFYDILM